MSSCFNLSACTDNQSTNEASFDTHIIFSSRRWWNYDIFISNVYANETAQLTKNKVYRFNPSFIATISERLHLYRIAMEIEKFI